MKGVLEKGTMENLGSYIRNKESTLEWLHYMRIGLV